MHFPIAATSISCMHVFAFCVLFRTERIHVPMCASYSIDCQELRDAAYANPNKGWLKNDSGRGTSRKLGNPLLVVLAVLFGLLVFFIVCSAICLFPTAVFCTLQQRWQMWHAPSVRSDWWPFQRLPRMFDCYFLKLIIVP